MLKDNIIREIRSLLFCVFALAMFVWSSGTAWGTERSAPITMKVETDYAKVLAGSPQTVFVLVEFEVREPSIKPEKRPQVNLSLVLDRSGSMQRQGKMGYAKEAAKFLVSRLNPTDILSVVEYDDRVTVFWPGSLLERPDMIQRQIDGLTQRGTANLTGA